MSGFAPSAKPTGAMTGVLAPNPPNMIVKQIDPTTNDSAGMRPGWFWLNNVVPTVPRLFYFSKLQNEHAIWILIDSGAGIFDEISTDMGANAVSLAGVIQVRGGNGIDTSSPGTGNQVFVAIDGDVVMTTLHTDDGNDVTPDNGVINVVGAHGLNTTGTLGPNTATWAINNAITLGDLANLGAGVPALTIATGDITFTATNNVGNLNMVNTHSSGNAGVIEWGGNRWIHNYGTRNTFVGQNAGNTTLTVVSADSNTSLGTDSLTSITTSNKCVAVGDSALFSATTAIECVAIGSNALASNVIGDFHVAVGSDALHDFASNDQGNTAIGHLAMTNAIAGGNCTAVGSQVLENILNPSNLIVIGSNAGSAYVGAESNNIILGNNSGVAAESNVMRLGVQGSGASQQNTVYLAGVIGGLNGVPDVPRVMTIATVGADSTRVRYCESALGFWEVYTGSSITFVGGQGCICNDGALSNFTLPATATVGYTFTVTDYAGNGWTISQNAGQSIRLGNQITTVGVAGSLASTAIGDTVQIVCVGLDTEWMVVSVIGNITVV